MRVFLSVLALNLLAGHSHGIAGPGACSGACNVHDPSLIRRSSDGMYFRFSTGKKISYASSPSIEGPWTIVGSMLSGGSSINLQGKDDLWAPDVQKVDGRYHVYCSVSSFGSSDSAIGLATSDSMDANTWTDKGSIGVTSDSSKNYNAIDANLLVDNGSSYLTFGSFWNDLFQVELNSQATKSTSAASNIAFQPAGTHAQEGPYLFKTGDDYYLFYSSGICCGYDSDRPTTGKEYMIKVCRSTSPSGGFVDRDGTACTNGGGTEVLGSHDNVYGPGGQGVFDDPELGPVLYYHYVDTTIGYADGQKLFGWNKLDFSSGWPVVQ